MIFIITKIYSKCNSIISNLAHIKFKSKPKDKKQQWRAREANVLHESVLLNSIGRPE